MQSKSLLITSILDKSILLSLAFFIFLTICTYSNPNDVVLDNCMGSGSTAVAAINTNRQFIGFEKDEKYFNIANDRIENLMIWKK